MDQPLPVSEPLRAPRVAHESFVSSTADSAVLAAANPIVVRAHLEEEKATYENGATRSVKKARFDLIPHEIDEALALRFALGAEKHGESNWMGGEEDFILECFNHGHDHMGSLKQNGPWHSDDDIAAILWNFGVLAWFRIHKPEAFRRAMKRMNPNWEA